MDLDRRKKNTLLAWAIGGLVLLVMLSSIPFWQKMFSLSMGSGGG